MANIKISELNELTSKANDDYVPIVDTSANETKKISIDNLDTKGIYLLAVDSTAPAECSTGDKYFNTTTNKIYTATGTDTWGTTGVDAELGVFYIVLADQTIYTYNGETLVSVGGGAGGGDSAPIGQVSMYAGSTAPNGFLMCNGAAVSRETYADLFRVIGTTYGTGDGSTTFNVPNIKGKIVVMLDSNDTDFDTLGKTGGSKELQQHNHSVMYSTSTINVQAGSSGTVPTNYPYTNTGNAGTGDSGNLQPYIVLNYIIKVQKLAGEVLSEQLPVGTEVDFDGSASDIPIGWEQVESYSTSEVKTGDTWIDGKPIYRKTFNTVTGNTSNTWNSVGTISNVNRIVSCNYEIAIASSAKYINSYLDIYASTTDLNEQHSNDYYNNQTLYITIEYTKTTD